MSSSSSSTLPSVVPLGPARHRRPLYPRASRHGEREPAEAASDADADREDRGPEMVHHAMLPVREYSQIFATDMKDIVACKGMLEYPINRAPANCDPFIPEILCIILMFLDTRRDALSVSATCHMWRFYANYLPHWTSLQSRDNLFTRQCPYWYLSSRVEVKRPATRDDIFDRLRFEVRNHRAARRWTRTTDCIDKILGLLVLEILIPASILAASLTIHWFVSWTIGYADNGINGDGSVGALTFFANLIVLAVEIAIAGCAFSIHSATLYYSLRMIITVVLVSIGLFTPLALLAARVNSAEMVTTDGELALEVVNATLPALDCAALATMKLVSFVTLPVPFLHSPPRSDITWEIFPSGRTLTAGILFNHSREVFCVTPGARTCFIILYLALQNFTFPSALQSSWLLWNGTAFSPASSAACAWELDGFQRPPMIAISVGGPEDTVQLERVLNRTANTLENVTSFRTVRSTRYFDSDAPAGTMRSYYNLETNPWWERSRLQLINIDWPETVSQARDRISRLYSGREMIFALAMGIGAFSTLLATFVDSENMTAAIVMAVLTMLAFSPPVMITIGALCTTRNHDPHMDAQWLMCDDGSGIALIVLGSISALVYICICCLQ